MNYGLSIAAAVLIAMSAVPVASAAPVPSIEQAVAATAARSQANVALDAGR